MAGGKTFGAVLSIAYIAIVTRSLGLDRFGKFALALGAGQAVASIVAFQSWQIVVRYGMPHLAAGRRDALARLLNYTLRLDIAGALIGAVLVVILIPLLGHRFDWSDSFVWQAAATGVVLVLSSQWTAIGILRLNDRFATAAACDAVTPLTRFAGSIIAWQLHPTPLSFLIVWGLAELFTAVAYWASALKVSRGSWRLPTRLRWRDVQAENPGIRNYAVATNLGSSLDLGGKQIAVLIVGLFVTPAAAAGYRIAQQLAQALAKVSQIMARAVFPELMRSRSHAGAGVAFEHLLGRIGRITGIGAATVFLLLLLIGRPALGLIAGPEFLPAYPILLLLGTAAAIDFAAVGFEPALIALGRPGLALRLRAIATAVLLTLMLALTYRYSGFGAAIAVLTGSLVSIILLGRGVWRLVPRPGAATPSPA